MNRNRLSGDEKEIVGLLLATAKEKGDAEFTMRAAQLISAIYGRIEITVEPIRDRSARRVRKALARKDADLILTDTVKQQAEDRKAAKARREAQRLLQKAEPEPFIIKEIE
jgi:hypothetical protein